MPILILARHGRSTSNTAGTLAGRSAGVGLDDTGRAQAAAAAERLAAVGLSAVYSSPLERCKQTASILVRGHGLRVRTERRLNECDYGEWTGHKISELARKPLWRTVQNQPSAARFPGGESLAEMSARAVAAVRGLDATVAAEHGAGAIWLAVSHGDIIKAVLADALGMHLDQFQRIVVDPASLSMIRYGAEGVMVLSMNSSSGSVENLRERAKKMPRSALVGGASTRSTRTS